MNQTRRVRMFGIAVLIAVVTGFVSQSTSALPFRKLFLPLAMSNAYNDTPQMMRLDDIALGNLDQALQEFGIAKYIDRQWVYTYEYNRRNGGGTAPESYPSPESSPEGTTGWYQTFCNNGEGCMATWDAYGSSRAQFLEFYLGVGAWSNIVTCPAGRKCSFLVTAAPTNLRPLIHQRQWISVRFSASVGTPEGGARRCFINS